MKQRKNVILFLLITLFLLFASPVQGTTFKILLAGEGAGTSWADWNETTESGWGDSNTYIVVFDNPVAGGEEVGQGGGLGATDLTLTQAGTVAGCTTTPPSRYLEQADDVFTGTTVFLNTFFGTDTTWTIIQKVYLSTDPAAASTCFWFLNDSVDSDYLYVERTVAGLLTIRVLPASGTDDIYSSTLTGPAVGNYVYVAAWSDGTDIRFGWSYTKPTKWSDFSANTGVSRTVAYTPQVDYNTRTIVGRAANQTVAGYYRFLVLSKSCLIDNSK